MDFFTIFFKKESAHFVQFNAINSNFSRDPRKIKFFIIIEHAFFAAQCDKTRVILGIYPEQLKNQLRDRLAYQGAQRLVSLGQATNYVSPALPQDGIEPVRRMVKWIVDETNTESQP